LELYHDGDDAEDNAILHGISPVMARGPIRDSRSEAEKAFKAATTKPADLPPKAPAVPGVKETVSLRIDRDVLDFFQEDGPGWQDRINDALRKAAGK
jgi:uncharacterized protein (DUF4415 family)